MAFGMHHFQPWRLPASEHLMNLETRFRGNRLIAYWATAVLISPCFQEFFASVSAIQHFLTIALFIITIPSLIEGICVRDNFLKADDFGVRCIFKGKVGLLTVFSWCAPLRQKSSFGFRCDASISLLSTVCLCSYACALPTAKDNCKSDSRFC